MIADKYENNSTHKLFYFLTIFLERLVNFQSGETGSNVAGTFYVFSSSITPDSCTNNIALLQPKWGNRSSEGTVIMVV